METEVARRIKGGNQKDGEVTPFRWTSRTGHGPIPTCSGPSSPNDDRCSHSQHREEKDARHHLQAGTLLGVSDCLGAARQTGPKAGYGLCLDAHGD